MDFISKEEKENIDTLNKIMGTDYRSKPYDFKNSDDIIKATIMATAEFADIAHYWKTLADLTELFDETIEVFNPAIWANLTFKGIITDKKINAAENALGKAERVFYELMDRTEKKCAKMWEIVLFSSPESVLKFFFGSAIRFDKDVTDFVLKEKMFEVFSEIEYDGVVETSAMNFAKALKEYLLNPSLE